VSGLSINQFIPTAGSCPGSSKAKTKKIPETRWTTQAVMKQVQKLLAYFSNVPL